MAGALYQDWENYNPNNPTALRPPSYWDAVKQNLPHALSGIKRMPSNVLGFPADIYSAAGYGADRLSAHPELQQEYMNMMFNDSSLRPYENVRREELVSDKPMFTNKAPLGSEWIAEKMGLPERTGHPTELWSEISSEFALPFLGKSALSAGKIVKDKLPEFVGKHVPEPFRTPITGLNIKPKDSALSPNLTKQAPKAKDFPNEVKSLKGEPVKKINEVRQKIKPNPYVAYHSTKAEFNEFDPDMGVGGQMWFTSKKDLAEKGYEGAQSGRLVKAELDIRNPAGRAEYEKYGTDELMGMGYDGIKLDDGDDIVSVAFFPEQVKINYNKPIVTKQAPKKTTLPKVKVGEKVDNRIVREHIPNQESIPASLGTDQPPNPTYEIMPETREISMSEFDLDIRETRLQERQWARELAEEISITNEINPLIVVKDIEGYYILEGSNRFEALKLLKAKSFPALVVKDLKSLKKSKK